eukprot:TRINITY_DN10655_c0_g2_i2.p3 TRINITY_DN10655_c0_g2~~TRINITY_DN10655_c0_g2_i2.p3  ORF type:complete len:118 (+),score=35.06 TRINITY_DN10655_c0_g2_i2:679-1032(+)
MLSAIVGSITGENDVKAVAMTALQSIIPFCEKNLTVEAERALLLSKIIENCESKTEEVKLRAMKCLLEVTKYFYDYIGMDGLELVGHVTIKEIKKEDNDDIGAVSYTHLTLPTICSV